MTTSATFGIQRSSKARHSYVDAEDIDVRLRSTANPDIAAHAKDSVPYFTEVVEMTPALAAVFTDDSSTDQTEPEIPTIGDH